MRVYLTERVTTDLGNVIAEPGVHEVAEFPEPPGPGFVYIETPEHYAGVPVSSVPVSALREVEGEVCDNDGGSPVTVRNDEGRFCDQACADAYGLR